MNIESKIFNILIWIFISTTLCCFLILLYNLRRQHTRKIQIEDLGIATLLILIAGLRYEVGSDYIRYMESASFAMRKFSDLHYLFSKDVLEQYSFEVGYEFLSVVTSWISDSKYAIFWTVAFLLYIPLVLYCRKCSNSPYIAVSTFLLFGFWGLSLNILKQAISMMFVICVFESIRNKRYILSIIFSTCSLLFHTTAALAILLVIIANIGLFKPTKKNLLYAIILGVILNIFSGYILPNLSIDVFQDKYSGYYTGEELRKFIWIGALFESLMCVFICYKSINNIHAMRTLNNDIDKYISIVMLGIPFSIMGISHSLWLANRFAKFCFIFLIIVVPALIGYNSEKKHYVLKQNTRVYIWILLLVWHMLYSVLMLDNNRFNIDTILFH